MKKSTSLNLSRKYAEKWRPPQALRECAANYIDAGSHKVHSEDNEVRFISQQDPGLDALLIMGWTDKNDAIGQFGEGNKLAALVLTRTRGASMKIESPRGEITFMFKKPKGFDTEVLHACIDTEKKSSDFITTLRFSGAAEAYREMVIPDTATMIPKANIEEPTRIYSRGIFVSEQTEFKSKYHWNLRGLELNRDRDLPSLWSLKYEMRNHLQRVMTPELATELLRNPDTEEARCIGEYSYLDRDVRDTLKAAFHAINGEKAIIQSSKSYVNLRAEGKGFVPVLLPDAFRSAFECLVPTADEVVSKSDLLQRINRPEHQSMLAEIAHLMDLLDIPAEVRVFADRDDGTLGHAEYDCNKAIVWLNEKIMQPGHRTKRIGTVLHELGHTDSRSGDESHQFERSLTEIAATLAVKVLDS